MSPTPRDAYLETQVFTATPQRLRLMLIEGEYRRANLAQAAFASGDHLQAATNIGHCRDIVAELIAGIDSNQTPLARQILSVYMFLYSTLVEAQFANDASLLPGILRILEEERQTWRELCEKMPGAPLQPPTLPHQKNSPLTASPKPSPRASFPAPNSRHYRESAFSLDA